MTRGEYSENTVGLTDRTSDPTAVPRQVGYSAPDGVGGRIRRGEETPCLTRSVTGE